MVTLATSIHRRRSGQDVQNGIPIYARPTQHVLTCIYVYTKRKSKYTQAHRHTDVQRTSSACRAGRRTRGPVMREEILLIDKYCSVCDSSHEKNLYIRSFFS